MRRLIVRPGGIGDCLLSFPAMEHLRAEDTEVWVPSPMVPLVQFADRVCSISSTGLNLAGLDGLPMNEALAGRLRQFDEIVSWYGSMRPGFREAIRRTGVRASFLKALPPPDGCCHATDFFCSQVGAPPGQRPRLTIVPGARRRSLVIHPFSGSAKKNWPLARFQELARVLDMPVEWIAGPEEELPGARRFDNLGEMAQWIAGAEAYIGNDSGISHLAAACGVRTIVIFGPTNPKQWSPRGANVQVVVAPDLAGFSVEALIEAIAPAAANA